MLPIIILIVELGWVVFVVWALNTLNRRIILLVQGVHLAMTEIQRLRDDTHG